jgi:hypothetical protein
MKQTAVEWMFEQFFKVKWGSMQGNMPTIFEQAKEMEKEQIKEAWIEGGGYSRLSEENDRMLAEKYYNETY